MKRLALAFLFIPAIGMLGCGSKSPPSAEERAQEILGPLEGALEAPTGVVDASTAKEVFLNAREQHKTGGLMSFVPGAVPEHQQGPGSPNGCMQIDDTGGSIDLGCMTGGQMTGVETYSASHADDHTYLVIDFQDVCSPPLCLSGEMAMDLQGLTPGTSLDSQHFTMVGGGDLDVTDGATSVHAEFAYREVFDGGTWTVEEAGFDDRGGSYEIDGQTSGDSGTFTITGSNGSYTCSWTEGGLHATCVQAGGSGGDGVKW